jgi:hypothetical protein
MNPYQPTKKFFTLSLSLALLSLAGLALIIWVLFSKILMINSEVQKTKQMSVSVEQAFKIKGQLNEIEDKISVLDSFFIGKNEEVQFIESLEKLASSTKVKLDIESISIDTKDKKSLKEDLSVRLLALGSRESLMLFLRSLENFPKAIVVDRADLSKDVENWAMRLNITAYKLK